MRATALALLARETPSLARCLLATVEQDAAFRVRQIKHSAIIAERRRDARTQWLEGQTVQMRKFIDAALHGAGLRDALFDRRLLLHLLGQALDLQGARIPHGPLPLERTRAC